MEEELREAVDMIPKGLVGSSPLEREFLQAALGSASGPAVAVSYLEQEMFSERLAETIPLPGGWLFGVAALRGESARNAVALIHREFQDRDEWRFDPIAVEGVVGGVGEEHGLARTEGDYLPDLQEPQLTKALANALRARGNPVRWTRIRTFLSALGVGKDLMDSLARFENVPERIVVQAESATDTNRWMDLRISWPSEGQEASVEEGGSDGVVIEAKFGANLQDNQLEDYKVWADDYLNTACRELIFLTPAGQIPPEPDKEGQREWRSVSWLRLMRNWEAELKDSSMDLGLVKQLIWRKVG